MCYAYVSMIIPNAGGVSINVNDYKAQTTETVAKPMTLYIEEYDGEGYTANEVKQCEALIFAYLDELAALQSPTDEAIMDAVRRLVLALNDLNASVDYTLTETGGREAIWQIIQSSAEECGLSDPPEDVTEEWREW